MFVTASESEAYQALNCQNFWHDVLTDGMGRGEITRAFPCKGNFAGNQSFCLTEPENVYDKDVNAITNIVQYLFVSSCLVASETWAFFLILVKFMVMELFQASCRSLHITSWLVCGVARFQLQTKYRPTKDFLHQTIKQKLVEQHFLFTKKNKVLVKVLKNNSSFDVLVLHLFLLSSQKFSVIVMNNSPSNSSELSFARF